MDSVKSYAPPTTAQLPPIKGSRIPRLGAQKKGIAFPRRLFSCPVFDWFGEGGILPLTPSPPKWPLKPVEGTFNGEGVGPEIPPSPHIAYQQVAGAGIPSPRNNTPLLHPGRPGRACRKCGSPGGRRPSRSGISCSQDICRKSRIRIRRRDTRSPNPSSTGWRSA